MGIYEILAYDVVAFFDHTIDVFGWVQDTIIETVAFKIIIAHLALWLPCEE